jgi:hypothetical protein
MDRHGVDGLARLAEASTLGDSVGWTLAQIAGDSVRDEVFARLGDPLADGWVRCRAQEGGRDWAAGMADALDHPGFDGDLIVCLTLLPGVAVSPARRLARTPVVGDVRTRSATSRYCTKKSIQR